MRRAGRSVARDGGARCGPVTLPHRRCCRSPESILSAERFAFGDISRLDRQPYGCILVALDAVFKALADASRRKLLDELHTNNGQTLSELCEHLDMTRQAVTKHLLLLEEANLVATVWRGREKLHFLNPVPLHEIYERWIAKYERDRLQALSDLKKGLEQNNNTKK